MANSINKSFIYEIILLQVSGDDDDDDDSGCWDVKRVVFDPRLLGNIVSVLGAKFYNFRMVYYTYKLF